MLNPALSNNNAANVLQPVAPGERIAAHERRHLAQAQRIIETPDFPR
ncbi:MAG: hypothetical protein U0Z53_15100 [Blastocatellia bacterium]